MKPLKLLLSVLPLLVSCSTGSYETGDEEYSYMRADFVEAHTVAKGEFDRAVTDDNTSLTLIPHVTGSWAQKADSTYRALLYYNKVSGSTAVEPIQAVRVLVVNYDKTMSLDMLETDPLIFESIWRSKNQKYLNIGFFVKTGQTGTGQSLDQYIGIRKDKVIIDSFGVRHVYITLTHNQNNVPEYYSSKGYLSLPLSDEDKSSTFHVTIHTYSGIIEKTI